MALGAVRSALERLRETENGRAGLEDLRHWLVQVEGAAFELIALVGEAWDDEHEETGDELALTLLAGALESARQATENDQEGGRRFLDEAGSAVARLDADEMLSTAARLMLATAFVRAGLPTPAALVVTDPGTEVVEGFADTPELRDLLDKILTVAVQEGTDFAYQQLGEMLGAMPGEMRAAVVETLAARRDGPGLRVARYFLLDPDAGLRRVAATALAGRARAGGLDAVEAGMLATVLPWLPDQGARAELAGVVAEAARRGAAGGVEPPRWKVTRLVASLPDAVGAATIAIAAQAPKRRVLAMLLLKEGYGIRDAYLLPCPRAEVQRGMLGDIEAEMATVKVEAGFVAEEIGRAIADGLAAGLPPAPVLIDVAEILGVPLEPRLWTVADMMAPLGVAELSVAQRERLFDRCMDWPDMYPVAGAWYEDSSESRAIVDAHLDDEDAAAEGLFGHLETRREWWSRLLAVAARTLAAARDRSARDFAAQAHLVVSGAPLAGNPVFDQIVDLTIDARYDAVEEAARPDAALGGGGLAPWPGGAATLDERLAASGLGPAWLDGFLTAVIVAPTMPPPAQLMAALLGRLEPDDQEEAQRHLDAIGKRWNTVAKDALDPPALAARMAAIPGADRADWARGFGDLVRESNRAWRGKSVGKADKTMLSRIDAVARGADPDPLWPSLGPWLAERRAVASPQA